MLLVNVVLLALSASLPETRLVIASTAGHRFGEMRSSRMSDSRELGTGTRLSRRVPD